MTVEKTGYLQPGTYQPGFQTDSPSSKEPTPEQKARRARLRRFNRLVVYLPVGLVVLAWLVLVVGLLWLSIAGEWFAMDTNQAYYRVLISAIADIFTMLLLAPLLLLCALPMVGLIAFTIYRRRRRAEKPEAEESLPLFWRIENIVVSIHENVSRLMPKVARPVISAHATAAFVRRFLIEVKQLISQEIVRNGDH